MQAIIKKLHDALITKEAFVYSAYSASWPLQYRSFYNYININKAGVSVLYQAEGYTWVLAEPEGWI